MNKTIKQLAEAYAAACKEEAQDLLRALGKIPAPTHREDLRAAFCRDWFLRQGAEDVSIDWAKNVICKLGPRDGELVVFAAHTDIVFPDTESLPMTEADGKLCAPGIGDATANLVNLMMAAKYLLQARPALKCGILIVANACEEGLGNLAGTRALFDAYGKRIRAFYSFDCYTGQCCDSAVGSYRYRVTCKTPGGHSYFDFGKPNAIAILAGLIRDLYAIQPPAEGRTTYNVGHIQGGTTVNSIPQEASMLYEFRSTSQECLERMERSFRCAVDGWQNKGGDLTVELLGVRPGNGPLDQAALAAFTGRTKDIIRTFYSGELDLSPCSTDSNIPLSLGIPANTVGTVRGGGFHTREEWVELGSLSEGLKIALSLLLAYTGLSD